MSDIRIVKYVSDKFLLDFRTNFDDRYSNLYKQQYRNRIENLFSKTGNIILSDITYEYMPLIVEKSDNEYDASIARENIRKIRKSRGHLTNTQVASEKIWVAMENTDYLDYHLGTLNASVKVDKNEKSSIASRTIFKNGTKRSLFINNLAILWWLGYYLYDEISEYPYHLLICSLKGLTEVMQLGYYQVI